MMKPNNIYPPQQTPGMNCPRCRNFISTSIDELLSADYLRCPTCNLQLNIDRNNSQKALNTLRKVGEAQKLVEKNSKFNG